MVFSRSEVKRRTKDVNDPLGENPKRTKVHAQRKFAQGSGLNSPIVTPIKEKEKSKQNGSSSPAELLPSKRPTTEDFLNFLCFRGTKALTSRLDFFNEAVSSGSSNNAGTSSSNQATNSSSAAQKIKTKNAGNRVFKKSSADERAGLQKGNAMRARTASNERQTLLQKNRIQRQLRRKAAQRKVKTIRKTHPSILKRLGATRLRAGLRSGGTLPPGSEIGLKTDRKPYPKRGRPKIQKPKKKMEEVPKKRLKREVVSIVQSENDSEDNEEVDEEEEEEPKREPKKLINRVSVSLRSRGASNSPASIPKKHGISSRPSRRTKEAATIYMEMLTKDYRNPDEEFEGEDSDDDEYAQIFPELPSLVKKDLEEMQKLYSSKTSRQRKPPNVSVSDADDEEEESLLKRSQRLQSNKAIHKLDPSLTAKVIVNKLKNFKKYPQAKKQTRQSEAKTESEDEEEEIYDETDALKSSVSSRYSQRKVKKKVEISSKVPVKRKNVRVTSAENVYVSEHDSDNATNYNIDTKKMRQSADNSPIARESRLRKVNKINTENLTNDTMALRKSTTRTTKKELEVQESENEYDGISSKQKNSPRFKKMKTNVIEGGKVQKRKAGLRKVNYKDDSPEEEDEDQKDKCNDLEGNKKLSEKKKTKKIELGTKKKKENCNELAKEVNESIPSKHDQSKQTRLRNIEESGNEIEERHTDIKTRSKVENVGVKTAARKVKDQRQSKYVHCENDNINEKNKKLRQSTQFKNKTNHESEDEIDSLSNKTKQILLRERKFSDDSDDNEKHNKIALRNSQKSSPKKSKNNSDEDENDKESEISPTRRRAVIQRKTKNMEDSDDEPLATRLLQLRKSRMTDESDEEEVIPARKNRQFIPRKVKGANEDTNKSISKKPILMVAKKSGTPVMRRFKSEDSGDDDELSDLDHHENNENDLPSKTNESKLRKSVIPATKEIISEKSLEKIKLSESLQNDKSDIRYNSPKDENNKSRESSKPDTTEQNNTPKNLEVMKNHNFSKGEASPCQTDVNFDDHISKLPVDIDKSTKLKKISDNLKTDKSEAHFKIATTLLNVDEVIVNEPSTTSASQVKQKKKSAILPKSAKEFVESYPETSGKEKETHEENSANSTSPNKETESSKPQIKKKKCKKHCKLNNIGEGVSGKKLIQIKSQLSKSEDIIKSNVKDLPIKKSKAKKSNSISTGSASNEVPLASDAKDKKLDDNLLLNMSIEINKFSEKACDSFENFQNLKVKHEDHAHGDTAIKIIETPTDLKSISLKKTKKSASQSFSNIESKNQAVVSFKQCGIESLEYNLSSDKVPVEDMPNRNRSFTKTEKELSIKDNSNQVTEPLLSKSLKKKEQQSENNELSDSVCKSKSDYALVLNDDCKSQSKNKQPKAEEGLQEKKASLSLKVSKQDHRKCFDQNSEGSTDNIQVKLNKKGKSTYQDSLKKQDSFLNKDESAQNLPKAETSKEGFGDIRVHDLDIDQKKSTDHDKIVSSSSHTGQEILNSPSHKKDPDNTSVRCMQKGSRHTESVRSKISGTDLSNIKRKSKEPELKCVRKNAPSRDEVSRNTETESKRPQEDKIAGDRLVRTSRLPIDEKAPNKIVDGLNIKPISVEKKIGDCKTSRVCIRKPSLNALAQLKKEVDNDEVENKHGGDEHLVPATIKRKSIGERSSCDTIGSGSSGIVECSVVLEQIEIPPNQLLYKDKTKHSKKVKSHDKNSSKTSGNLKTDIKDESIDKSKQPPFPTTSLNSSGFDRNESFEKEKTKPSINDTWRQAFIKAKLPKPGHLSPVQNSVKPFVRQKMSGSSLLTGTYPGKNSDPTDSKAHESRTNVSSCLSPLKSFMAHQNQRSQSPDAKRHLSPAHKPSYGGLESSLKRNDELKMDLKKQDTPVKSLTQLQYEKRSSELISSLDSGSVVLPGFESIRAYRKDIKRDDPKSGMKQVPSETPLSSEPVKPSAEGKHQNLPLAVEHTLRKMSPITVSKKPPVKPITPKVENVPLTKATSDFPAQKVKEISSTVPIPSTSGNQNIISQPVSSSIDLLDREPPDLNFMAKKKVNMTNEEINRWLNDSTSTGVEHKKDCGIFENNQCECSYRTSGFIMQNSVGMGELVPKEDSKIDHGVVEPPVQLKELDNDGKYIAETISTCKVEDYKEKLLSKSSSNETKMAPPKPRRSSGQERFKGNRSMTEEEMCEYDFRFERTSNSPRESMSDVSSITHRDDASSSSELPERKIFHQKRSKEVFHKRPSISSPTAFSAENESSVYAFTDQPSISKEPFRRGRGKSGEQDVEQLKESVAVQVNLTESSTQKRNSQDSESLLECSTQTERPSSHNNNVFFIPLPEQAKFEAGRPQGVTVKVDTKGPDQSFVVHAKFVTKHSGSLPQASFSSRVEKKKPEQKVRPLISGKAVGKVPPTMREPENNEDDNSQEKTKIDLLEQPTQSTSQPSPKEAPESPKSRSSSKTQKVSESTPAVVNKPPVAIEWKGTEFPAPDNPATLVEAPTFYPTEKEFQDPLEYIETLTPLAQSFGICRIVPPSSFKPECKVSDDMRFTAYNQYVNRMMERWGPNNRELCAIRKYLATQNITLNQIPMIGSMEVDLPRLYQTVQLCGGLKEVYEKKRWARVADAMKIPKSAQDRITKLDDIYCKYLLPYTTISHDERTKFFEEADNDWKERERRLAAEDESANNSADGSDESSDADDFIFECITKGKNMPLSVFFRVARNTMATWFKDTTPTTTEVETEFWRHVQTKTCHVCVHCGSIDSGSCGYGFPTTKTSATSRHPWNLKVLTNSPGSILRSLGPLMGVTVPTLHVGMLFSSCCWYRDPHALPWIEYLHDGASKIWYGVPDSRANELRNAMYPLLPRRIRDRKIWLPSDTMMVPPQFLLDRGVSLCRVVQEPGQFILVFPKAFTSSICTGYLVSESVYFAQPSWLSTAEQVFKEIQDSCEPPVFSLHKLLFNIANDSRSSADILMQVLPMIESVIEKEMESRKKLESLGLTSWEVLPTNKSGWRKKVEEDQEDVECDTCRGLLFLSMVHNSNEECYYCIDDAIETLTKDQSLLKYCKPMLAYDEEEMDELVEKVQARIETKIQKKQKEKGASRGNKNLV